MGILTWILFGLIAGIIAKLILPGKDPGGFIITTLLGIAGALLGGFIGSVLGWGTVDQFDTRSMLLAIGGAILMLLLYRALRGKKA
ncbi:MAG: GlsB/YeaQ/YmgE family stress response membrane protein [Verrucomicrobiales bacterium]|jgi:uncharacterized membrane protein YeaQ/YmgE (transglycosylase-associated protein family)|nr:GlsB/YeaQ/YmgE family stress response membrane protein [Verrucomicrobiales bacterium]MBP9223777.1 GlsB/YeaQ/YmgE family stress response membrane protein [Verrucomicrobiales bacterium]HQZ28200.1 GlsB/YeaQ/YmgE family stress response membrane protein [Verrucomicrobiales bacterium]